MVLKGRYYSRDGAHPDAAEPAEAGRVRRNSLLACCRVQLSQSLARIRIRDARVVCYIRYLRLLQQ